MCVSLFIFSASVGTEPISLLLKGKLRRVFYFRLEDWYTTAGPLRGFPEETGGRLSALHEEDPPEGGQVLCSQLEAQPEPTGVSKADPSAWRTLQPMLLDTRTLSFSAFETRVYTSLCPPNAFPSQSQHVWPLVSS